MMRTLINDALESTGCIVANSALGNKLGSFEYSISCDNPKFDTTLKYIHGQDESAWWESVKWKIFSILSNQIEFDKEKIYNQTLLNEFIENHYIELSPEDKMNCLLENIRANSKYDGDIVDLHSNRYRNLKFKNINELNFYIETARHKQLIAYGEYNSVYQISLTVEGITRLIKSNENKSSKHCFIAMAFEDEMFEILDNSIKPALTNCGYTHLIVSDQHIESDKTINDAILAGIKKSLFTIADFTHHRKGVYFEAGYALGRGQKVIYSCREDHIKDSHFDLRNYQHIVWKDAADFKQKLIDKIEAFIKD